jgi:hypothetical protein
LSKIREILLVAVISIFCVSCAESDSVSPNVVETFPANGSTDVDSSITEISVTFDEPMTDGNWSWAYSKKDMFPEMNGQPYYQPGLRKNVLPVDLEPNKEYEVWNNSNKFKNFKDQAGNSAVPFRLVFKTK